MNFHKTPRFTIHNHEVRSSILRPATRKHSTSLCFFVYSHQAWYNGHFWAQRKIPVVRLFDVGHKNGFLCGRLTEKRPSGHKIGLICGHHRHKAGGASPWA